MMNVKTYLTLIAAAATVTSCDLDQMPEGGTMLEDQKDWVVSDSPEKIQGELNALKDNIVQFNTLGDERHFDYGFPAICLMWDQAGQDMVSDNHGYNWFSTQLIFADRIPEAENNEFAWKLFYKHIKTANTILNRMYIDYPNEEGRPAEVSNYIGQALASRAFDYLSLIQMYQFTYQGHENALGLPIIIETTTLEDATNNPRATVQAIYDLIMQDLNTAIKNMEENPIKRTDKAQIDAAVAYGLRARANMLLGKYAEAASDAENALSLSGATPYSFNDASVPSFNDVNASSWIWGSILTANNEVVQTGIINWPSHLCSLTGNGYTTGTGMNVAMRRINSALWDKIPATDVRKTWWLDQDTLSAALEKAYGITGIQCVHEVGLPYIPYVNVKFGPEGNQFLNTENSQDWPLMRAEEMILIKAEALARSQGVGAGKTVLEDFVKSYRDPEYTCTASSLDAFIDEVWFQRRVELWGEGFSLFDILRLKKPIVRIGANFAADATYADIAPESPIMIYCIPEVETSANKGIPLDQINEVATPPTPIQQ